MRKYHVESENGESVVNAENHAHALALVLPDFKATSAPFSAGDSVYYVDDGGHIVTVSEYCGADLVAADMEQLR